MIINNKQETKQNIMKLEMEVNYETFRLLAAKYKGDPI